MHDNFLLRYLHLSKAIKMNWTQVKDQPVWELRLFNGFLVTLLYKEGVWYTSSGGVRLPLTAICEGKDVPLLDAQEAAMILVQESLNKINDELSEIVKRMDKNEVDFAAGQLSKHEVWGEFLTNVELTKRPLLYPALKNRKALIRSLRTFYSLKQGCSMPFYDDEPLSKHVQVTMNLFDEIMLAQVNRT